jgi:arylsulfatase A-like enzyme
MLSQEQVQRSYTIVRTRPEMWKFTFGAPVYSDEDLGIIGGVYDACLAGLDNMFENLLDLLQSENLMENTAVILTSDHGELLGEHHLLGNDFALYQELLRTPMILHYPPRAPAGRDKSPVMNLDVFPTVLELAGVEAPKEDAPHAVSLLAPATSRSRIAEYPVFHRNSVIYVRSEYPDFPREKWMRSLRSIVDGEFKLIWGSDGRHELYNLGADTKEAHNVIEDKPQVAKRLLERLEEVAGPPIKVHQTGRPATQPADDEP